MTDRQLALRLWGSLKTCGGVNVCECQLEVHVRDGQPSTWHADRRRCEQVAKSRTNARASSFGIMSGTGKVIRDDDDAFTGLLPPRQRRHTLAGNSSLATASDHAPVVWRAVMPIGRRSTLASRSDAESGEFGSTIDGSTRVKRSISDTTSMGHRPGDKNSFALHDVDAFSVQRAKVIRRISEERYIRFRDFFNSYEPEMAKEIQARSAFSREQLDAWVNYIVSPRVLRCIVRSRDPQQDLLDLLKVSAAISKYGESELMAKDRRGDLSALQNIKLHTYDEYSPGRQQKKASSNVASMDFVVRINGRLSEERRVGGVVLREILVHASTMEIEDNQAEFSGLSQEEKRFKQIVLRVQSEWFQDAILKANGRFLYDAVRQVLSNVNDSLWETSKDRQELRRVRAQVQRSEKESASARPSLEASTSEAPLVPSPLNAAAKVGFTIDNRSSSMPAKETQERESTRIVGTDKTRRRKLLPLGTFPRPRGLPFRRPQRKRNDPIVHAPSAFRIKPQQRE